MASFEVAADPLRGRPVRYRPSQRVPKRCALWWLHVEAVVRREALWKAWEVLRLDPGTGASVWLRDHADPAMTALTKPDGTFHRCGPTEHQTHDPIPVDEPPPGMF